MEVSCSGSIVLPYEVEVVNSRLVILKDGSSNNKRKLLK